MYSCSRETSLDFVDKGLHAYKSDLRGNLTPSVCFIHNWSHPWKTKTWTNYRVVTMSRPVGRGCNAHSYTVIVGTAGNASSTGVCTWSNCAATIQVWQLFGLASSDLSRGMVPLPPAAPSGWTTLPQSFSVSDPSSILYFTNAACAFCNVFNWAWHHSSCLQCSPLQFHWAQVDIGANSSNLNMNSRNL